MAFYFRVEESFEDYSGGIYDEGCFVNIVNHAMVLVGYDFSDRWAQRAAADGTGAAASRAACVQLHWR